MGTCALIFVIYSWRVFQTIWIIGLALSSAFLLRVGRWGEFPPIVTWYVYNGWHLPYWGCLYLKGEFLTTWLVRKSWGLRSVLDCSPLDFLHVWLFLRTLKLLSNSLPIYMQSTEVIPPDLLGCLRSCRWIFDCLTTSLEATLWYLDRPLVSCDGRGSKFIGRTDSWFRAMS